MKNKTIKVLIISSQALLRHGLELAFSSVEDIEVAGSMDFNNGVEHTIEDHCPDEVIVDIDGYSETGMNLAIKIKQHSPNIGIIMLTSNPEDNQLFQALKAQASAYLSKEASPEKLINTIRCVASGEYPINESLTMKPSVAARVLKQFQELSWQNGSEAFISPLTPRETQILRFIAQGFLNKQIAAELGISEQTIKNHVTSILRKLNANARTEAVVIAIKQGILTLD
jgi:DNA-binding NarL/FixJ family response regulator